MLSHTTAAAVATTPQLAFSLNPTSGAYNVSLDGEVWFHSASSFITINGTRLSTAKKTLVVSKTSTSRGLDELGAYSRTTLHMMRSGGPSSTSSSSSPIVDFSIAQYDDGATLTFEQSFPRGLNIGGNQALANSVATSFPAWSPGNLSSSASKPRGWMAYDGWDCDGKHGTCMKQAVAPAGHVAYGVWDTSTTQLPDGLEGSGPMVIFANDLSRSIVVSAMSNVMAASQEFTHDIDPPSPPTPGPPRKVNFTTYPQRYCVGNDQVFEGNISFKACEAKCVALLPPFTSSSSSSSSSSGVCTAFDYRAGPPFAPGPPGASWNNECRIGRAMSRIPKPTGQNYTCYLLENTPSGTGGTMRHGVMASIKNIPAGWSTKVMLSAGTSPTSAVRGWGTKLLQYHGKSAAVSEADFITNHLGYDTDNGAFYYYNPLPNKSYYETLLDVHSYSVEVGLPYRHVQIDSWWYIKGEGGGTKTWAPDLSGCPANVVGGGGGGHPAHACTFPDDGLAKLHNKTGWVYTAHNRMWAGDVTYAKQNGGKYDFVVEGTMSLPNEQQFWDDLMSAARTDWGLEMYEQDWLYTEFVGVNGVLLESATMGREWMLQMGRATHEQNLGLQLCMAWPRHVLQSLEMASVTQGRASPDYHVATEQWRVGDNALFLDALALRPTKDCFQSNETSGETAPALQAAVSALSAGPVFPCDQIGTSDVALIMRTCNMHGELLQPSRTAAPLDAVIKGKAGLDSRGNLGEIWKADVFISALHYPLILAADSQAYTLTVEELQESASAPAERRFLGVDLQSKPTSSAATLVDAMHPLPLVATTKTTFALWALAPILPSGWTLLGELNKFVPVSTRRFSQIVDDSVDGLSTLVHGPPGEVVEISTVAPTMRDVITTKCVLPSSGEMRFRTMGGKPACSS